MRYEQKRVLDILFLKDYVFNSDYFDFIMENSSHNISLKKEKGKIYDAVFCLNQVMKNTHVETYNGNIFAVMQESGAKNTNIHRFMYDKLNQYDRVFSSIVNSKNTIQDIPYLEWHIKALHKDIINLTSVAKKNWRPVSQVIKETVCRGIKSDMISFGIFWCIKVWILIFMGKA